MQSPKDLKGVHFCLDCENVAFGESSQRGHVLITILLFLLFIVPGVIYLIYRTHTKGVQCEHCHSKNLMPITAGKVKRLLGDNYATVLDDAIEYAKPLQKARQRQTYLIVGFVFVFLCLPSILGLFFDRKPPPAPVKAPEVAKAPEKIKSSEPQSKKIDINPAPSGDEKEVASSVIAKNDQICDDLMSATRLDDGSIAAICHNGNDYIRYRVFTFVSSGKQIEAAMDCTFAKTQGISGC